MKEKSLKTNFIMNSILTMSSFIFPLITFPYISRILMPVGSGKVSFASSLIQYFNMFAQLGIPVYGIRMCAQVRDNRKELTRVAHELLFLNTIMALVSYLFLAIALVFVPRLQEDRWLYIIVSFTIILTDIGMNWLYQALEQYTYITIRSLVFKIIAIIAMFLLVKSKNDYMIYGAISIFAGSASNICNFINVHKFIDLRPVGNYNVKRHIKPVLVFFAMSCATTIYTSLDTVMLGFLKTDKDVGYYSAAVKVKSILVSIVTSLGTVLLPRTSYYITAGKIDEFRSVNKKAINFVLLASLPMSLYFMLFAKQGIYLLSGEQYNGAIIPMQIIMPTLIFIGISNILGIQILIPLRRETTVLVSEILGAITDFVLNLILIPKFGASGAAIGTLIAELIVVLVQGVALKNSIRYYFKGIQIWKIIISLLIGTILCIWTISLGLAPFFILLISSCIFWGSYCIILIIIKEPLVIEITNQLFNKINLHFKV